MSIHFENQLQAIKYCEGKYPTVHFDFGGMSLEVLDQLIPQINKLAIEYPGVMNQMKLIGRGLHGECEGGYASINDAGNAIHLNEKYFSNAELFKQCLQEDAAEDFHPEGCNTFASVFSHEFGHAVETYMRTPDANLGEGSALAGAFADKMYGSSSLSHYSPTNPNEAFAEGFAAIHHAPPGAGCLKTRYIEQQQTLLNVVKKRDPLSGAETEKLANEMGLPNLYNKPVQVDQLNVVKNVEGTEEGLQPGKFATIKEAQAWMKQHYPKIICTGFSEAHVDCLNPTIEQFHILAQKYPKVAKSLQRISVEKMPADIYAQASGESALLLNPKYYGNPKLFNKVLTEDSNIGFGPKGCGTIAAILTHEFGHSVQEAYNLIPPESGNKEKFFANHPDISRISQYAMTNYREAFAESFVVLNTPTASDVARYTPYVTDLARWSENLQKKNAEKAAKAAQKAVLPEKEKRASEPSTNTENILPKPKPEVIKPASPPPVDPETQQLLDWYQRIEAQLTEQLTASLLATSPHEYALAQDRLRQVENEIGRLRGAADTWDEHVIRASFHQGQQYAADELLATGISSFEQQSFNTIPTELLKLLASEVAGKRDGMISNILRQQHDYLRTLASGELAEGFGLGKSAYAIGSAIRNGTINQIRNGRAIQDLADGIVQTTGVRYSDGSIHSLQAYGQMAARTGTMAAYAVGAQQNFIDMGVHVASVSKQGSLCYICRPLEGKCFALDEEGEKQGYPPLGKYRFPLHPNCLHSLVPEMFPDKKEDLLPPKAFLQGDKREMLRQFKESNNSDYKMSRRGFTSRDQVRTWRNANPDVASEDLRGPRYRYAGIEKRRNHAVEAMLQDPKLTYAAAMSRQTAQFMKSSEYIRLVPPVTPTEQKRRVRFGAMSLPDMPAMQNKYVQEMKKQLGSVDYIDYSGNEPTSHFMYPDGTVTKPLQDGHWDIASDISDNINESIGINLDGFLHKSGTIRIATTVKNSQPDYTAVQISGPITHAQLDALVNISKESEFTLVEYYETPGAKVQEFNTKTIGRIPIITATTPAETAAFTPAGVYPKYEGKFKSLADAQQYCQKKWPDKTFDFGKGRWEMHIDTVGPTVERMEEMFKQYPAAEQEFSGIMPDIDPYAFASAITQPGKGTLLRLSSEWYKDPQKFHEELARSVAVGFHPEGCDTFTSIFDHEFGHVIAKAYNDIPIPGGIKPYDQPLFGNEDVQDIKTLSEYAASNADEAFAEAFCALKNSPKGVACLTAHYTEKVKKWLAEPLQRRKKVERTVDIVLPDEVMQKSMPAPKGVTPLIPGSITKKEAEKQDKKLYELLRAGPGGANDKECKAHIMRTLSQKLIKNSAWREYAGIDAESEAIEIQYREAKKIADISPVDYPEVIQAREIKRKAISEFESAQKVAAKFKEKFEWMRSAMYKAKTDGAPEYAQLVEDTLAAKKGWDEAIAYEEEEGYRLRTAISEAQKADVDAYEDARTAQYEAKEKAEKLLAKTATAKSEKAVSDGVKQWAITSGKAPLSIAIQLATHDEFNLASSAAFPGDFRPATIVTAKAEVERTDKARNDAVTAPSMGEEEWQQIDRNAGLAKRHLAQLEMLAASGYKEAFIAHSKIKARITTLETMLLEQRITSSTQIEELNDLRDQAQELAQREVQTFHAIKNNLSQDDVTNAVSFIQAEAIYKENGETLKAFVRAQYDETQAWFKEHKIKEVILYRGMGLEGSREKNVPQQEDVLLRPLSSFAHSLKVATDFHGDQGQDIVLGVHAPVSQILSNTNTGAGCLNEDEMVVLGGHIAATVVAPGLVTYNTIENLEEAFYGKDLLSLEGLRKDAKQKKEMLADHESKMTEDSTIKSANILTTLKKIYRGALEKYIKAGGDERDLYDESD